MPIFIAGQEVQRVFVGTTEVTQMYQGTEELFSAGGGTFNRLTDSIVVYDFSDTANISGTTVTDLSANGYDGTIQGASTYNTGGYMQFAGNSTYISLPDAGPFTTTGSNVDDTVRSVAAWMRFDNQANSDRCRLYQVIQGTGSANRYFLIQNNPSSANSFYCGARRSSSSTQWGTTGEEVVTNNTWHHLVVQTTGADREIYFDGVRLATTNTNNGGSTDASWITYANFSGTVRHELGRFRDNDSNNDSEVSKVYMYNRHLTQAEITTLFNEGSGVA